jgi:hypothetical protein
MAQLRNKVKKYAEANGISNIDFRSDVILFDDGDGAYIHEWNLDIAQPTDAQLDSYEDIVNAEETLNSIHIDRRSEYPDIGDQLDDLFKAGAFSTEMTATIQAVKDKYPKE